MKTSSLKRKAPMKKKSGKPKPFPKQRCCWSNRCKTRADIVVTDGERYCDKHATWILDALVGDYVKRRDGGCVYCGRGGEGVVLQWAHIHTRGMRYIKYVVGGTDDPTDPTVPTPGNSVCLCAGHHFAFTNNEGNWRRFMDRLYPGHRIDMELLNATYEARGGHIDKGELIRYWRSWWAERGYKA